MPTCIACGGQTQGFKCAVCGNKSPMNDEGHPCGSETMQPMCATCDEAQDNCMCVSADDEATVELGEPEEQVI